MISFCAASRICWNTEASFERSHVRNSAFSPPGERKKKAVVIQSPLLLPTRERFVHTAAKQNFGATFSMSEVRKMCELFEENITQGR